MELKETKALLLKFKNYVIQQSRSNLSKGKKNDTKTLYNSVKGEIVTEGNYSIVGFTMSEYGAYQDEGVKGADPSKVSKNAKIRGQQAPNSRFSFKNKRPPSKFISEWAKAKNIRLRDAAGKLVRDPEDYNWIKPVQIFDNQIPLDENWDLSGSLTAYNYNSNILGIDTNYATMSLKKRVTYFLNLNSKYEFYKGTKKTNHEYWMKSNMYTVCFIILSNLV